MTLYAALKSFSSNSVALTADFGRPAPAGTTADTAIAAATLMADGTPAYAGPDSGTTTTTGPAAFGLWFHSTDPSRLAASAAAQVSAAAHSRSHARALLIHQRSDKLVGKLQLSKVCYSVGPWVRFSEPLSNDTMSLIRLQPSSFTPCALPSSGRLTRNLPLSAAGVQPGQRLVLVAVRHLLPAKRPAAAAVLRAAVVHGRLPGVQSFLIMCQVNTMGKDICS